MITGYDWNLIRAFAAQMERYESGWNKVRELMYEINGASLMKPPDPVRKDGP